MQSQSSTNAKCSRCNQTRTEARLDGCGHCVECIRCDPWRSKGQGCRECQEVPSSITLTELGGKDVNEGSLMQFRYLGIAWTVKTSSQKNIETRIADWFSLRSDRMTLLANGQSYKPNEFNVGFEAAHRSGKVPTLVASTTAQHGMVENTERAIAREIRQTEIRDFIQTIYTAIFTIFETIWLFFVSLIRPPQDLRVEDDGPNVQRPHQD